MNTNIGGTSCGPDMVLDSKAHQKFRPLSLPALEQIKLDKRFGPNHLARVVTPNNKRVILSM